MKGRFLYNTGTLTAARLFTSLSQLVALPVVARFLSVEEFGLVALAMVVVLFTQLFSDAGLGRSLIRQDAIDRAEWSSVFWLLVVVGLGLSSICLVMAPIWAWAYESRELFGLVAALSVVPFLLAVSAVPSAWMERHNRFASIALIRTLAAGAGVAAAVGFAVAGFGAWALVFQQIALATVQCLGIWVSSRFRPMSPRHRTSLRGHIVFARDSIAVSFLQTAQRQVPAMLIGHVLGAVLLGLHSMAQRLLIQPSMALSGPMAQVAYVRMAKVKSDNATLGELYNGSIRFLALAIFPPVAVIAGGAGDLFGFVLSEPWRPVGILFALAAPGYALEAVIGTAGVVYQAVGQTGARLRMVFERVVLRLIAVAIAVPFGVEAVAATISIFALLYLPRFWQRLHREVPFDRLAALKAMGKSASVSALAFVAMFYLSRTASGWEMLGWAIALMSAGWVLAAGVQYRSLRATLRRYDA